MKKCTWSEDDCGTWESDCGKSFVFDDGGPTDNLFQFCPYCGDSLVEVEFTEEDDDYVGHHHSG